MTILISGIVGAFIGAMLTVVIGALLIVTADKEEE